MKKYRFILLKILAYLFSFFIITITMDKFIAPNFDFFKNLEKIFTIEEFLDFILFISIMEIVFYILEKIKKK